MAPVTFPVEVLPQPRRPAVWTAGPALADTLDVTDLAVQLAVLRLSAEFAGRRTPEDVEEVVTRCRVDLGGSPVGALPELVERLARHRLDTAA